MKKAYYKIIHHYQNKTSLEFINIGVMLYDNEKFIYKLLDEHDLKNLHCNFINKYSLERSIEYIDSILFKVRSFNDLKVNELYFDDFDFSSQRTTNVLYDLNDELASVYKQFISYKFEEKIDHLNRNERIINLSESIIQKQFKGYLEASRSTVFDLIIKNKNTENKHSLLLGSLLNKSDISRTMPAIIEAADRKNLIYGFTNKRREFSSNFKKIRKAQEAIETLGYELEDFSEEKTIISSLESIVN